MVEGETLLVLLLLGRCRHPTTAPQPARKGQEVRNHIGTAKHKPRPKYIKHDLRFHRLPLHEVSSVVKNIIGRRMPPKGWLWASGLFD